VEDRLKEDDWKGMTYRMTGEYKNQRRFVQTMLVVFSDRSASVG
jgi:Cu(I)/Ag(I) efflux system membrane protein CusA/SilA